MFTQLLKKPQNWLVASLMKRLALVIAKRF
jgi:hypothetical protein